MHRENVATLLNSLCSVIATQLENHTSPQRKHTLSLYDESAYKIPAEIEQ